MIEDALRNRLLANTAITDIIGQRMYVLEAPQGVTFPFVVYHVVNVQPTYTNTDTCDEVLIQYSVFADKYIDARTVANLIRADIEKGTGLIGSVSVAAIFFEGIGANEREKDSRKAHVSYDFKIFLN